ncbi:hypothetical protein AVEN_261962-1 [Araneus ventricosus]|uniref:Uncharacterized protein n=1 Tax=Araneus ventricosus TaxID=182803 RepID=A0A4Y2ENK0_ARAVE|nr:hypothetical protein AVEN_261962-1 [Araneus ventricosus]
MLCDENKNSFTKNKNFRSTRLEECWRKSPVFSRVKSPIFSNNEKGSVSRNEINRWSKPQNLQTYVWQQDFSATLSCHLLRKVLKWLLRFRGKYGLAFSSDPRFQKLHEDLDMD